jgi:uncharacterized protein YueI
MNTSGEVADLMVKEGIQITESSVKLMALGAKNLTAIIMALLQDENKLQGKTNLKQLLKSDKPLCILQIKEDDLKKFNSEAKKYGVLFTAVSDKTDNSGFCDIIAKQDDVTKLNYIMEKMNYTAPVISEDKDTPEKTEDKLTEKTQEKTSKNSMPRAKENQSKKKYTRHGDTTQTDRGSKPSVKEQIEEIKAQKAAAKKDVERKPLQHQQSHTNIKKKKTKGKSR